MIFAIPDLKDLLIYFGGLFPFFGSGVNASTQAIFMKQILIYWPFLLVSILLCTPHWYRLIVRNRKKLPVILLFPDGRFLVLCLQDHDFREQSFMYFSF